MKSKSDAHEGIGGDRSELITNREVGSPRPRNEMDSKQLFP